MAGYKVNKDNLQKALSDLFGPNLPKAHGISVAMGKISQSHLHTHFAICIIVSFKFDVSEDLCRFCRYFFSVYCEAAQTGIYFICFGGFY